MRNGNDDSAAETPLPRAAFDAPTSAAQTGKRYAFERCAGGGGRAVYAILDGDRRLPQQVVCRTNFADAKFISELLNERNERVNRSNRRGSFRAKMASHLAQQRSKASKNEHLRLPKGVAVYREDTRNPALLDILPYYVTDPHHPDANEEMGRAVKGSLWYRRPYRLHRLIGTGDFSRVVCPTSVGKKCPICEYKTKRLAEGANWDDKSIKAMKYSERSLYYIELQKDTKDYDKKKPYIWDISDHAFHVLLLKEIEEDERRLDFPDPEVGHTLRVRFDDTPTEGGNTYPKCSRIDFQERNHRYEDDYLRALPSLDDCLDVRDYREVERLFFDASEAGGDDNDDDRRRSGASSRDRDEDDDDVPRSGRPSRALPSDDDSDDDPRSARDREDDDGEAVDADDGDGDGDDGDGDDRRPRDPPTVVAKTDRAEPRRVAAPREDRRPSSDRASGDIRDGEKPRGGRSALTAPRREPAEERRSAKPPRDVKKPNGGGECPSGYVFGVDTDKYAECEECSVFFDCMDAKEDKGKSSSRGAAR